MKAPGSTSAGFTNQPRFSRRIDSSTRPTPTRATTPGHPWLDCDKASRSLNPVEASGLPADLYLALALVARTRARRFELIRSQIKIGAVMMGPSGSIGTHGTRSRALASAMRTFTQSSSRSYHGRLAVAPEFTLRVPTRPVTLDPRRGTPSPSSLLEAQRKGRRARLALVRFEPGAATGRLSILDAKSDRDPAALPVSSAHCYDTIRVLSLAALPRKTPFSYLYFVF